MREFETVKLFSKSSPDLYQAFKDLSNQMLDETNGGLKKFSYDTTISLMDKKMAVNKMFAEELQKRSGYTYDSFDGNVVAFGNNSQVKEFANSIAKYMIDMVLPIAMEQSTLSLIADFHFAGYGDTLQYTIKNNALLNVSEIGRRQKHTQTQKLTDTTATIATKLYGVTVISNLPEVLLGKTYLADLVMKAVVSMQVKTYTMAVDKFTTVMDAITGSLKITNYTEKSAIEVAQKITTWNQGRKAVFVGTPIALKSLLPNSTNTRILLQDEYNTTVGHLRTFNGYDTLELTQVADLASSDYGLKLPDDRIYVLSPSAQKLIQVGIGEESGNQDGTYDNANLAVLNTIKKELGVDIATNSIAAVIQLA